MSFRSGKKELARKGKVEPLSHGTKGFAKKFWHRITRRYGREIVREEVDNTYTVCLLCQKPTQDDEYCEHCGTPLS